MASHKSVLVLIENTGQEAVPRACDSGQMLFQLELPEPQEKEARKRDLTVWNGTGASDSTNGLSSSCKVLAGTWGMTFGLHPFHLHTTKLFLRS